VNKKEKEKKVDLLILAVSFAAGVIVLCSSTSSSPSPQSVGENGVGGERRFFFLFIREFFTLKPALWL
jgi:hypothetical protein